MKVAEVIKLLDLKVIAGEAGLGREVTGGYTSDLLSDVIGSAKEGSLWITIQTHHNIVAVSSLKELSGIIIVKGLHATEETIRKANDENIPVLACDADAFTATGWLYEILKSE